MDQGIQSAVFDSVVDGKKTNLQRMSAVLQAYGFRASSLRKNVYERIDLDKKIMAAAEDRQVTLHTSFAQAIRPGLEEAAARRMMELNAEYGYSLGLGKMDNCVCFDYSFVVPAKPLTEDAFRPMFAHYFEIVNDCALLIETELQPFSRGLLDDEDKDDFLHGLHSAFRRHRRRPSRLLADRLERGVALDEDTLDMDDILLGDLRGSVLVDEDYDDEDDDDDD